MTDEPKNVPVDSKPRGSNAFDRSEYKLKKAHMHRNKHLDPGAPVQLNADQAARLKKHGII